MRKPQPKTNAQVRRIFGLAKPKADAARMSSEDYLHHLLGSSLVTCHSSRISELTFDEANLVIKQLGGDPFPKYGQSKRNQNYRKQQAGVKSIETEAQLKLIRELGAQRNIGDEGLTKLATRMRLPWPPNTTEQGNKLVEALKAMIKRDAEKSNVVDGNFASSTPHSAFRTPQSKEPSYRRVA